jgi:hypothetical protein
MQLLTVVGGTGTQGRSVIEAALKGDFRKIRALTRNPDSKNPEELATKGVEVVKADLDDEASLVKASEVSRARGEMNSQHSANRYSGLNTHLCSDRFLRAFCSKRARESYGSRRSPRHQPC